MIAIASRNYFSAETEINTEQFNYLSTNPLITVKANSFHQYYLHEIVISIIVMLVLGNILIIITTLLPQLIIGNTNVDIINYYTAPLLENH